MNSSSFSEVAYSSIAEDMRIIEDSGLFDEVVYRTRALIAPRQSAIEHYLHSGGLNADPMIGFDGAFLKPYYEFSGLKEPPFLTWLTLRAIDGEAPFNREAAEARANNIRQSPYFDPAWFGCGLPADLDPALLYAVVGEPLGQRPSRNFDPNYYVERYPDLKAPGLRALDHFTHHGAAEGRRCASVADTVFRDEEEWEHNRGIVVIAHEASRSGAPLLALSLVRELSQSHPVVSVLLRGGEIFDAFNEASQTVVGPFRYEDYVPIEMRRVAERIVMLYRPRYVIANSIESCFLVPYLAALGVPVIALVHEFAGYTRPLSKLSDMYHWAAHVVFPARIVAESAFSAMPELRTRNNIHIFPQGRVEVSVSIEKQPQKSELFLRDIHPDSYIVLGAGHVQIRKGIDIFLSTAAALRRLAPDLNVCFAWVGDGYRPDEDMAYSIYLAEQISRSGLEDVVVFLPPTDDIDSLYRCADAFYMCSRLDPQPNVGIDAMYAGLPVVAFEDATGTAEVLLGDELTRGLVAPHLDAHAAAEIICRLAQDNNWHRQMSEAVAALAARTYEMESYVRRIDRLGMEAAERTSGSDRDFLATKDLIDLDMIACAAEPFPSSISAADLVIQQWVVNGLARDPSNPHFRRPRAGFHPQVYAAAHLEPCVEEGRNPFVHWLQAGEPDGPWIREVIAPLSSPRPSHLRLALHAHFHYPEVAWDVVRRLASNASTVDLFVTTDTPAKSQQLERIFRGHRSRLNIAVLPNRGRDIAPFIHVLSTLEVEAYDLIGHVHGKKSIAIDEEMGARWCRFLFENLIGGASPSVDTIAAAGELCPRTGLFMAEDPHIVGWNKNRELAMELASIMKLNIVGNKLPDFIDFPLGTMFWARPAALKALTNLDIKYPSEPLPYDGTVLHALERLIPHIVRSSGFDVVGIRIPGSSW